MTVLFTQILGRKLTSTHLTAKAEILKGEAPMGVPYSTLPRGEQRRKVVVLLLLYPAFTQIWGAEILKDEALVGVPYSTLPRIEQRRKVVVLLLPLSRFYTDFGSRNFERRGKASEEGDGVVPYVEPPESML